MHSKAPQPLPYISTQTEPAKRDIFWERPNGWPMLLATVILSALLLIEIRSGATLRGFIIPSAYELLWGAVAIVGLVWFVRCVGRLFMYAERGAPPNAGIGRITIAVPLIFVATGVAIYFEFPMRFSFYCSQRAFEQAIATAPPGMPPRTNRGYLGLYRVTDVVETAPGELFFRTAGTGFDREAIGFTYSANGQVSQAPNGRYLGNRRRCKHITGNWYWTYWSF